MILKRAVRAASMCRAGDFSAASDGLGRLVGGSERPPDAHTSMADHC